MKNILAVALFGAGSTAFAYFAVTEPFGWFTAFNGAAFIWSAAKTVHYVWRTA